jgi:DNA-binding LytR/AlgR family response regulator
MIINCIIIDDEPLARKGLKEYINEIDFLNLSGEFDNPLKATSLLNNQNIQLLFLDIQMPKITGLEWIKTLQHLPQVIFTTAWPQYALDGFELNALDYLVKPISFDRFYKAALKAKEYFEVRNKNMAMPQPGKGDEYFFIKSDNKLIKILFDDVLYAEALQNYVCIHTTEKKHITYLTLKAMEEYLPGAKFIRTHKSFIISAAKVDSIDGTELLIGTHRIPISRHLKDEVIEKLVTGKYLKR